MEKATDKILRSAEQIDDCAKALVPVLRKRRLRLTGLGLFILAFRVLTAEPLRVREVLLGAAIATALSRAWLASAWLKQRGQFGFQCVDVGDRIAARFQGRAVHHVHQNRTPLDVPKECVT